MNICNTVHLISVTGNMWYILLVLCLYTVCVTGQQCYPDWSYFDGSCYGFGEEQLAWAEAQEFCETFNGKLAEVETSAENDWLKSMSRAKQGSYWLGGTDIFHEGSWLWAKTMQPIYPFSDWGDGQPSESGGHEDCMGLWQGIDYQWNDATCEMQLLFICETSPVEVVVG